MMLTERGVRFEEYRYLELGIDTEDLELLLSLDGVVRVNDITSEVNYLGDKDETRKLLISEPKVLQRPILIHQGVAVIGRPPEDILTLLPEV
tara:strand:- start:2120 stop:2395 length:276 start_codon:yes stop_codon:yes gene_type:complete